MMTATWETPLERFRRDYGLLRRYLERLGADGLPASAPDRSIRIKAPSALRRENTPSFEVRPLRVGFGWKDWGDGEQGTIVDLVMRGEHLATPGDALRWLLDWTGETPAPEPVRVSVAASVRVGDGDNTLVLRYATPGVSNAVMRDYLLGRGLSPRVFRHLHDVGWTDVERPGSKFFGVGVRNLRGDWHVRSALEGARGKRLVRGRDGERNNGGGAACALLTAGMARTIDVVEGALNGLALVDVGYAGGKLLSLNGAAQAPAAAIMLAKLAADHSDVLIRLHADRDPAGQRARQTILEAVPGLLDLSDVYADGDALDRLQTDRNALIRDLT